VKDYPLASWMPAHHTNYKISRPVQAPSMIVIHCTDGHPDARPVAEMWQEPNHGSSAHFVIGQDGAVIQTVRIADTAWHAHGANGVAVGIEHCARTPKEWGASDPGLPPSDALYVASARLVRWLCETLAIKPSRVSIVGHAEADAKTTHRVCPTGCGWDWPRYMAMVAGVGGVSAG
jgi:N-acetyl-anhydromuramyl-L-alanine amidase AmpD